MRHHARPAAFFYQDDLAAAAGGFPDKILQTRATSSSLTDDLREDYF
jgi:hypothetical protein